MHQRMLYQQFHPSSSPSILYSPFPIFCFLSQLPLKCRIKSRETKGNRETDMTSGAESVVYKGILDGRKVAVKKQSCPLLKILINFIGSCSSYGRRRCAYNL